jgi:hypothetical protein
VNDLIGTAISPTTSPKRATAPRAATSSRNVEKFANFTIDDEPDTFSKYGNV